MTEVNSQSKDALINLLFADIVSNIEDGAKKKIDELQSRIDGKIKKLDDVLSGMPITVNLGSVEKPKNEVTHKRFNDILNILQSAKRKEKNIMLVGGAGGGKTHLCKQVADALKLPFYPFSVGLQTTKSDLMGFINATGVYVSSPIRRAFEDGGVLLLDEFDAAHAGVVTILNSLLANQEASFPDKTVQRNEKFICICACNTYGRGANIDYVGRNRLDGATLDRFIVLDVDYDKDLEKTLTRNNTWVSLVDKMRNNIQKQGIKMIVSPRASMDGADLLDAGFSPERVVEMVIYKGCDEDIKKKIMQGVDLTKLEKKKEEKKSLPKPEPEPKKEEKEGLTFSNEYKNCLFLDFDEKQYSYWSENGFKIHHPKWDGSFQIAIGEKGYFTTYLSADFLYVNNTEGSVVDFEERSIMTDGNINHFINSLKKHHGSWVEEKVAVIYKYKGQEELIILGE